jgi:MYXO-CTERM domain-containing protein
VDWLLRRLSRTALRHGMAGEHWAWFLLGLAAFLLRRARHKGDDLVLSRRLEPGERYLVTLSAPGRRGRPASPVPSDH